MPVKIARSAPRPYPEGSSRCCTDKKTDLAVVERSQPGNARTDQGLVADELEGEAHQDRREGRQPRPPAIAFQMAEVAIPRQMFQEILRLIAESTAAASACASVRRRCSCVQGATDGRSAFKCHGKWPDQPLDNRWVCPRWRQPPAPPACLAGTREKREYLPTVRGSSGESGLTAGSQ